MHERMLCRTEDSLMSKETGGPEVNKVVWPPNPGSQFFHDLSWAHTERTAIKSTITIEASQLGEFGVTGTPHPAYFSAPLMIAPVWLLWRCQLMCMLGFNFAHLGQSKWNCSAACFSVAGWWHVPHSSHRQQWQLRLRCFHTSTEAWSQGRVNITPVHPSPPLFYNM